MRYMMHALALAGLVGAGLVAPSAAQAACSGGSVMSGTFGVLVNGASGASNSLNFMAGVLKFDGNCGITGTVSTGTSNSYSVFLSATGSYVQNADKTFTVTITPANQAPQVFAVAYSSTAMEAVGVQQSPAAITSSISLQAQVIATTVTTTTTTPCPVPLLCILNPPTTTTKTSPAPALTYNTATLAGTWAASCFSAFGSTDLNYVTFDGKGNITSTSQDYYNNSGGVANSFYTGTYGVLSDGEFGGAALIGGSSSNLFNFVGEIDNQQTEIQYFYAQNGAGVTACTGHKI